jgi:uncharacterized membrane protein
VWNAARRTFARLGIDRTRGRNGVLVFIVPARHQVVVLADEAADAQLGPALWSDVAARIASACARGEGTEGLEDGIARLAGALSVPFPHEPGDVNELPDQPHVGGLP